MVMFFNEYVSLMCSNFVSKNIEEQNKWLMLVYEDVVVMGVLFMFEVEGIDVIGNLFIVKSNMEYEFYFDVVEEFVFIEYDVWVCYELGLMKLLEVFFGYGFLGLNIDLIYNLFLLLGWKVCSQLVVLKLIMCFGELICKIRLVKFNYIEVIIILNML